MAYTQPTAAPNITTAFMLDPAMNDLHTDPYKSDASQAAFLINTIIYMFITLVFIYFVREPTRAEVVNIEDSKIDSDSDSDPDSDLDSDYNPEYDYDYESDSEFDDDSADDFVLDINFNALFTGKWRTTLGIERLNILKCYFNTNCHDLFVLLPQKDEALRQAQSAHTLMKTAYGPDFFNPQSPGFVPPFVFLAAGAGRGSAQFTVLNSCGNELDIFTGPGIPKNETNQESEQRNRIYSDILTNIATKYKIDYAVFFDSFFHLIKNTDALFIPDGNPLPKDPTSIPTWSNYINYFGFDNTVLVNEFNPKTLVIRNVRMPVNDSGGEIEDSQKYKISFCLGEYSEFDIGSGNAALVDSKTGTKLSEYELGDWENDEFALQELAFWLCEQSMQIPANVV